jgi:hypothetical protein
VANDFSRSLPTTVTLRPSGVGEPHPFFNPCSPFPSAPNWANVAEAIPDDFASYNYLAGTGTFENPFSGTRVDRVTFTPDRAFSNPTKVTLRIRVRRTSGTSNATPGLLFLPDFEYGTGGASPPINTWQESSFEWLSNPFTGLPWADSDFTNGVPNFQAWYRLAMAGESSGVSQFIYATQFWMEVLAVPGVFFRDGFPNAGTAFRFFADADQSIFDYLSNAHVSADLNALRNYLIAQNVTLRPHRYEPRPANESPSNFPVVYFGSYFKEMPDYEARTLMVRCGTVFHIWDSQTNPLDASTRVDAIASTILSMLRQIDYDRDAFTWTGHYANFLPHAENHGMITPTILLPSDTGKTSGMAYGRLSLDWIHAEDL